MSQPHASPSDDSPQPWWRFPIVWMVIGGPAVVVVAGIVTAVIAVRGADIVITDTAEKSFADKPAVQGRNHAATPEPTR
jgi:uncharacterized protein